MMHCPKMYKSRRFYLFQQVTWSIALGFLMTMSRVSVSGKICENKRIPEMAIRKVIVHDFFDRPLHRSFNLIPPLRRNLATKISEEEKQSKANPNRYGKVYNLYGDRKCPNTTDVTAPDVISRSTCPWFIYMDVDEERMPKVMAFAECRCRSTCVGDKENRCMPVYSYPTVLRRICRTDGYEYFPVTEKHPVGCTCTAPRR